MGIDYRKSLDSNVYACMELSKQSYNDVMNMPVKKMYDYLKWKEDRAIPGVSKVNEKLIINYVFDMESGINIAVGTKKGGRSYTRLNALRTRLRLLTIMLEKYLRIEALNNLMERELMIYLRDL